MTQGKRRAIIDIGSNSVRLVIFGGAPRAPVVLYNEKLMAGLGRGVIASGALSDEGMALALAGLARFKTLIDAMGVDSVDAVATAAVRDAANRADFMQSVAMLGLGVRLLSGEEEAQASGFGVLSAIPQADGIVADLGGGSLELVRVRSGAVYDKISLPLGILKVPAIRSMGAAALSQHVEALISSVPWVAGCAGLPLYLVGGSWRSLARIHMMQRGFPLTVLGNYVMAPDEVGPLSDDIAIMDKAAIKAVPSMPSTRVPMVADAAALLAALAQTLRPSHLVTCAFGLREGLLYHALEPGERAKDPLIEGVRFATEAQQQVHGYGLALYDWTDGLFGEEPVALRRLRQAVCMLHGTGWASNPDFRALGGEELALHGNWVGVTASDRAAMGMALFIGMGGKGEPPAILSQLAEAPLLNRARQWGYAIRLAQRLSGGAPSILLQTSLHVQHPRLDLCVPQHLAALDDPVLRRRLDAVTAALDLAQSRVVVT